MRFLNTPHALMRDIGVWLVGTSLIACTLLNPVAPQRQALFTQLHAGTFSTAAAGEQLILHQGATPAQDTLVMPDTADIALEAWAFRNGARTNGYSTVEWTNGTSATLTVDTTTAKAQHVLLHRGASYTPGWLVARSKISGVSVSDSVYVNGTATTTPPPLVYFVRLALTGPTACVVGDTIQVTHTATRSDSTTSVNPPNATLSTLANTVLDPQNDDQHVVCVGAGTTALVSAFDTLRATLDVTVSPKPTVPPPPTTQTPLSALLSPRNATLADVNTLGGSFTTFAGNWTKYGTTHKAAGITWETQNYYDRAASFYALALLTGDQTWATHAAALAVDYRERYLQPNKTDGFAYNTSDFWHMPVGLAAHFLATGDSASWRAVGYSAEWLMSTNRMAGLTKKNADGYGTAENRTRGRMLLAAVTAHSINAPQGGPASKQVPIPITGPWSVKAKAILDSVFVYQAADGGYRDESSCGAMKPFMDGLLNHAMIQYYRHVDPDPRIVTSIKRNLDILWTKVWDPTTNSFYYYEYDCTHPLGSGSRSPAPDLNNLIVQAFGFVAARTGDATYWQRGDLVFTGALRGYWQGSKQFNQLTYDAWAYPAWKTQQQ